MPRVVGGRLPTSKTRVEEEDSNTERGNNLVQVDEDGSSCTNGYQTPDRGHQERGSNKNRGEVSQEAIEEVLLIGKQVQRDDVFMSGEQTQNQDGKEEDDRSENDFDLILEPLM